ncbi:hypothetical protein EJ04DRAFT_512512 [Polyplosphaeria fusca]|uniref:Uncharacterized protein n=1 Tax=Polyplosphaeria fusca TaxID=682080 RepID=A0A9P4QV03_9PLEO|nr:hypothetical protein EJ04DRAFT_512512 [Polyplosphaeria fusca]
MVRFSQPSFSHRRTVVSPVSPLLFSCSWPFSSSYQPLERQKDRGKAPIPRGGL